MQSAKWLFALSCVLLLSNQVKAQRDSSASTKKMYLHTQIGIQLPDFSNLNDDLEWMGFNPLAAAMFSRGTGFYAIFPKSRLVTMANYQTFAGTKKSNNRENAFRGTVAGSSFGYNLVKHNRAHLIPYLGVQYSWFGTRLSRLETEEQSFPTYLEGAANQYHITTNGWMGTVGVHAAFMPFNGKNLISNAIIGLKVGYFAPLNDAGWKSNDTRIHNGPKVNSQGLSAGIVLGFALN